MQSEKIRRRTSMKARRRKALYNDEEAKGEAINEENVLKMSS